MAENGFNLGTAWIQISPSMKGLNEAIRRELGDTDTRPAEKKITTGLGGAFQRAAKAGALALGAMGAVGAALGFAGVAREALAASDATDKFRNTLSFAGVAKGQIDALTKSTKKYADDTVYELSDIQNITAQLAANGVKGYDQLAEAAGNLNAVAGGNAETFKSVGMVLTQTAGQGKLTTENWNQLADAIPGASGKIQEALLKNSAYTGNFRDAMAKGEITADEFNKAILDLGFTDVARQAATSTSTIEGAWGNLQAALVTGGMDIVDKLKPAITDFMGVAADGASKAFDYINTDLMPALGSLWDLISGKGYDGNLFGLASDSAVITALTNIRNTGESLYNWVTGTLIPGVKSFFNLAVNGDFDGNFFGVKEDSGLVSFILDTRDKIIDTWKYLQSDVIPGVKDFLSSVVNSSFWSTLGSFFGSLIQNKTVLEAVVGGLIAWKTITAGISLVAFTTQVIANTRAFVASKIAKAQDLAETIALKALLAGDFLRSLVQQTVQIVRTTAAWVAQKSVLVASRVATSAYTAAQWLLNAALNANPISLIVVAIAALVAALVLAYNKSETFRGIIEAAWSGIQSVIGVVVDWFQSYLLPVFEAVWEGIKIAVWVVVTAIAVYIEAFKAVLQGIADFILTYVWPYIQQAWDGIKTGVQVLWEYMQAAWNGIKAAIQVVSDWVSSYIVPALAAAWNGIKAGADLLWSGIQAAWNGIKAAASTVVGWFQSYVQPVLDAVWKGIKAGADLLLSGIRAVWDGIKAAASTVVSWFQTYVQPVLTATWNTITASARAFGSAISSVWNGIKSTISSVVSWMTSTVQSSMTSVANGVKSAFTTMKSGLETIWNGVKGVVAKPVNFVINTVYTQGIKKTADSMAEKLGLSLRLPAVSGIAGYASGGVLPGYTPGRDIYHFFSPDGGGALALSGGEAIMRPEWVRAVGGPEAVARMNAAARSHATYIPGGDTGVRFAAYADGGIWGAAKRGWDWVKGAADTVGKLIADPVGAVAKMIKAPVNALLSSLPGSGIIHDSMKALPIKWVDGFADWLSGKTKTMGATGIVNAARKAIGVPYVWGGSSIPPGLDCSGLVYWAAHQMGSKIPRLTAAGYQSGASAGNANVPGNLLFWGSPAWHVAIASGGGRMVEAPKPGAYVRETGIWGSPTAGVYKFDNGGFLQPGVTTVVNKTGRPEPVFTSAQWDALRAHGAQAASSPETLVVVDEDGQLMARMRVVAQDTVDGALVPASRGRVRDMLGTSI
nr:MAG TPA: tail tape measure [Bacteriophage sp.]